MQLFTVAAFLCLLAVVPAFGQAIYSDEWLSGNQYVGDEAEYDESMPNVIRVDGSGVTDGSYTHNYYVDTTLRSPDGRTNFRHSGRRIGYARADVSLGWDPNYAGDYSTNSEHFARCPSDELYYYSIGSTFDLLPIGVSFSTYRKAIEYNPRQARYCIISPCDAKCKAQCYTYATASPPLTDYIRVAEPYLITPLGKVCNRIIGVPLPIDYPLSCVDVDL